ncbi:poly(beta-D-mannuronate) lyase [Burkholderia diffusa]|uniref:Poly(Beta-D-mannuronate) lyase n=2 Tax=Burkholderia diffusa TaxID=488732 RepID=A0A6P2PXA1_9BURK|nr:poly(beta-D-mannuronate) lyase [Burkholderia diffusa]
MASLFAKCEIRLSWLYLALMFVPAGINNAHAREAKDIFHAKSSWGQECAVSALDSSKQAVIPEIFPVVIRGTPGRNLASEQLYAPVMSIGYPFANLGSACMAGNKGACDQFSEWLDKLVNSDALKFDREKHKGSQSSLVTGELAGNSTLRPIAIYTSMLRRHNLISMSDRKEVFDWMRRRAANYSHISGGENEGQLAQNLVLSSAATQLAVGITTSDDSLNGTAAKAYRAYIDTMRSDGSFPAESRRGQSALKYENNAIALLVLVAELELVKGVDLYSYRGPSGDIHKAIKFWIDALQNESVILGYAAENFAPTDPVQPDGRQALHFLRPDRGMTQMGWVIPYMQNFPNRDNAKRIAKLIDQGKIQLPDDFDSILGVYPRCFWAMAE